MKRVIRHLRRAILLHQGDGPTDGQLLESFETQRDETAFEALLRRHGRMVLGVCRRVLGNAQDAEDAFQATFLVLVKKASTIRPREMVGNWLYGVAYRTAMKARAMSAKRRTREKQVSITAQSEAAVDGASEELLEHLDRELSRLPDKYRVPLVLCELEGKGRKEVARTLGLPEGTLSWRLAQGRKLLARKLARYGAVLSGGALAALVSSNAASAGVPLALFTATARAGRLMAAGHASTAEVVSARVAALTEGVMKAMLVSKLKMALWMVALAASVSAGAVGLTYRTASAQSNRPVDPVLGTRTSERPPADELEALRLEIEALRKSLQATRERVKTLEGEVRALKGKGGAPRQPGRGVIGLPVYPAVPWPPGTGTAPTGPPPGVAEPPPGPPPPPTQGEAPGPPVANGPPPGVKVPPAAPMRDPFAEAEAALKRLRNNPGDKQAERDLERAMKRLKERPRPDSGNFQRR